MQRTAVGSLDADIHVHNDPPASTFGPSVTPAKRITFYKSGDAQFKGVKMAVHKRGFKCFDALLDDLSQKVPLPFGVRTITTPRGTHSIKHLEQLEDGGCYLCSDRRHVKPIDMEAAGKRPAVWHHHSTRRKPSRPEEAHPGHTHHHRHPKRIVLVKNSDPAFRRSVILSRRSARSLRVFTDEISELMQCHVKKLYTLEGRKIDSVQSLMQCPGVLVCVGREPFRPLVMEGLKKISDEKLPGMSTRPHSGVCSDGHESKKNVNFGLETKKSIIHPRSDSSNRSTRFSLSSEKSYQNGLCMTPGHSGYFSTCPYVKEVVVNDDIEKRVLVNKDGSLSVEMKVRFRLFNDETLQWSTEIKKSSTKVNKSGSVKDGDYLQAKAEYSDPDSISASETDEAFAAKKHLEETLCQNCCNHCQEYDIWKNPMHKDPEACKSPSSSGSSHRVVRKKSSVDSMRTISRSSGEYVEHVVEKASCFQETMEEGDTRVQYCEISHCCNRSEVSSAGVTSKSQRSCEDGCESKCSHSKPEISSAVIKVTEERPISAVSNSSKVLESLKEDQDDDYDDLPPSISRASGWSQSDHLESDDQPKCLHCCGRQNSPSSYLSPRPPSKDSSSAVHSLRLKKYKTTLASPVEPDEISKVSSRSHMCDCRATIPSSAASSHQNETEERACSKVSRHSQVSCKSRSQVNNPASNALEPRDDDGAIRSLSATSGMSRRSGQAGVCSCCGEHKRSTGNPEGSEPEKADSVLSKSNKSAASTSNSHKDCEPINNTMEGEATRERSESKNSKAFSASKIVRETCSAGKSLPCEHNAAGSVQERTKSARSDCIISERESTPALVLTETGGEKSQERAVSKMSVHSNLSAASGTSHKSKSKTPRSCSPNDLEEVPSMFLNSQGDTSGSTATQNNTTSDNHCGQDTECPGEVRSASAKSNKSNRSSEHPSCASAKTTNSVKSGCKATLKSNAHDVLDTEVTTEERLRSSQSNCSKTSVKTNVSSKHGHAESKSKERVSSAMSAKTNGSSKSLKPNHNVPETTVTSVPTDPTPQSESDRAISAMSQTSVTSKVCSVSQEMMNGKDLGQNALTVSSPSPRPRRSPSPRSKRETDSRAPSGMSSKSQRSSRCNCHSSSSGHLRGTNPETIKEDAKAESEERLSGKSKLSVINNVKSSSNQLDEPLSPTSTASVSLGLGEELRADDFDECSNSGMSAITENGGQTLETVKGVDVEERPKTEASQNSAISNKSKKSNHENCKTPVSAERIMSAELKNSKSGSQKNEINIRVPSGLSLSSSRSKSPSGVSPGGAKNTAMKEKDCEAVDNTDPAEMTEKSGKATPASDYLNCSKVSERSVQSKSDKRSKCSSHCLETNVKCNGDYDDGTDRSLKTSTADRRSVKNNASRPNSATLCDISQNCLTEEIPNKKIAPVKHPDSSNESILSRALSAADLLREIVSNGRPVSTGSKSQKSSRSKHSKISIASESNNKELMPSCLPNASPTEVVNDWLRNIPIDAHVYEMDVELTEDQTLAEVAEGISQRDKSEAPESIIEVEEPHEEQEDEDPIQQETDNPHVEKETDPKPQALIEQDGVHKQCHSSVQVMKVLLGPKLDRSSSLPEVSPVYGRKLSQSAQGLLDCLASLRLIDSDSQNEKHRKYNEVMMILQSLWLQKPSEDEQNKQKTKEHHSVEEEFNPHSSSGVDVNSGSNGSMNGVMEQTETTQGTIPLILEQEASVQDNDQEEVKSSASACERLESSEVVSDPVTPDIAERIQGSPLNAQLDDEQENADEDVDGSENKNESDQTAQTTSCSGNESYTMKSQENTSSGTPPSVQRVPLAKRVSQDPDPVWVLSLLKKLEKQFMVHYADAMAEFKVRWDLDDNEMLDTMIKELKEEVHKRIQSSIERELQKIQSRVGRSPRPPGNTLSRESTAHTDQRRKRLRVMRNKSISMSRSDENNTASGTENSDQRSDDEYCPCDACIRKKMESRAVQRAQALTLAPVMMDFDLRKILQMKRDPPKPLESEKCTTNLTCGVDKEENNLDVVHEEVEDMTSLKGDPEETSGVLNGESADDVKDIDKKESGEDEEGNEEGENVQEESVVNVKAETHEEEAESEEKDDVVDGMMETKTELDDKGGETETAEDSESKANKDDTPEMAEDEIPNEEKADESDETSDTQQVEENVETPNVKIETDKCSSVEEDREKERADETTLDKQATRTSVESQPGSMENCINHTEQAKLKDLQSFMESIESQAESMVVITKQPPYKEPHVPGIQKNLCNGLREWQVSPKISNRANKQRNLKDGQ